MIGLVDFDILAYRCAASAQEDPVEIALLRCSNQLEEALHNTGVTSYSGWLSGESNFRYEIYPEYKANRKQEKPRWLQDCREYLVTDHAAKVTEGYEADDAIGIASNDLGIKGSAIVISDDKDLLQLAGQHYNLRTQKMLEVSDDEALWMFYFQLLVGDSVDNIKGVKGIGKVKAQRVLEVGMSELEMFDVCRDLYNNDEEMLMNGQLLYILRQEGNLWQFPQREVIVPEQEALSVSMR